MVLRQHLGLARLALLDAGDDLPATDELKPGTGRLSQ
jgi:hypothetical protein